MAEGLAALANVASTNDGLKKIASLFVFVRRRYGLERGKLSESELASMTSSLGLADAGVATRVADAAWSVIEQVIRGSFAAPENMGSLVAGKLPDVLAKALVRVCWELQGQWKNESVRNQLSLPKLKSLDWRVDVKTASSHASGLGVPCVIVQMTVEPNEVVSFEMDKETLQALLSGLGKIRSQLAGLN